jgi:hypothetical protein
MKFVANDRGGAGEVLQYRRIGILRQTEQLLEILNLGFKRRKFAQVFFDAVELFEGFLRSWRDVPEFGGGGEGF